MTNEKPPFELDTATSSTRLCLLDFQMLKVVSKINSTRFLVRLLIPLSLCILKIFPSIFKNQLNHIRKPFTEYSINLENMIFLLI